LEWLWCILIQLHFSSGLLETSCHKGRSGWSVIAVRTKVRVREKWRHEHRLQREGVVMHR
jgi:hypothetical protein